MLGNGFVFIELVAQLFSSAKVLGFVLTMWEYK